MFNEYKMSQIISNIKNLPRNAKRDYMLITNPGNHITLIRLKGDELYIAQEGHPDSFVHIPKVNFKTVYNELVRNRKLTVNDIGVGLSVEGVDFIMAILGLLPNVTYNKSENLLCYS